MTDVLTTENVLALAPAAQSLLFTDARTANTFSDEPVTDEQLRAIFDLVKWPPTAANTQPLRVLYVRTPEARERLVAHLADGNKAKTRTAPVVAVLAADTDFHHHVPRVFPIRAAMKDQLDGDPEAREKMARFNATLQAGYFLLGVRAAGLAAGPMGGFDGPGIDGEFFPDGRWRTILVVNIGKPGVNAWFDRLPRLDYEDVVRHA
ncbi:MAG TPA: malonic semialdehyde reductase [Rugosimonospora sp.]|nr:malonic semialdehyde reductase [Rugosimonospora sp.]